MEVKNLERLGKHIARSLDADAKPDDVLRAKLAERAATGKLRIQWTDVRILIPVFGLVSVLAVSLWFSSTGVPPLGFTVGTPGRPGVLSETVTAPGESGVSLRFSEGSRVALDPRARVRVTRLERSGAELVVESGRAHVDVVPRAGNTWRVRTGPFVVAVKGTRFDIDWSSSADRFALDLYEGKVIISGCSFGAGQELAAGQRAEASCRAGTRSISSLVDARDSAQPASRAQGISSANSATAHTSERHAPSFDAAHPVVAEATAAVPRSVSRPSGDWVALARSGQYADAYALASSIGVAEECGRRGADEVLLLGESARLTDHVEDARLVYQVVRRRFAKSSAAAHAAFNLGRLDARAGNDSTAAGWFETYLREQPSGAFAAAALGRLLEARVKLGDTRAAHETARSYLERYPTGPHADAARKVLESESGR